MNTYIIYDLALPSQAYGKTLTVYQLTGVRNALAALFVIEQQPQKPEKTGNFKFSSAKWVHCLVTEWNTNSSKNE